MIVVISCFPTLAVFKLNQSVFITNIKDILVFILNVMVLHKLLLTFPNKEDRYVYSPLSILFTFSLTSQLNQIN